ncbi:hypothetical protein Pla144_39380 [Bythopirellula polymerisocia]|uniref:Uncharacterized protein n=1 Tax=Bythopirellula polymerisocia TaxID=2528003 RepID=A0A5C6CFR3_9BACT|nr:hypothetical protein Pla144_39380 [Bythopirellula polymerisocia]
MFVELTYWGNQFRLDRKLSHSKSISLCSHVLLSESSGTAILVVSSIHRLEACTTFLFHFNQPHPMILLTVHVRGFDFQDIETGLESNS